MTTTFTAVTRAPVSVDSLFAASLDIDAHVRSMNRSGEHAIAGVTSGQIGEGQTVTWRARHFGVWLSMTTRVSNISAPDYFFDEQLAGPFRSFRHAHRFFSDGSGVLMIDRISFESPMLGVVAERIFLRPYLRYLIRMRNRHLVATAAQRHREV